MTCCTEKLLDPAMLRETRTSQEAMSVSESMRDLVAVLTMSINMMQSFNQTASSGCSWPPMMNQVRQSASARLGDRASSCESRGPKALVCRPAKSWGWEVAAVLRKMMLNFDFFHPECSVWCPVVTLWSHFASNDQDWARPSVSCQIAGN